MKNQWIRADEDSSDIWGSNAYEAGLDEDDEGELLMPLYEINTVSTYRHKYMVDAQNINDAYDALRGGNVDELSTRYLTEVITEYVTNAQAETIMDRLENDDEEDCARNMRKSIYKV